MSGTDFTTGFTVEQSPEEVFKAINTSLKRLIPTGKGHPNLKG